MKRFFVLIASALLITIPASVVSADYVAGVSSYKKRHYRECIRLLQAYTAKTPDPRAYYLMGYASYKLKNFSEARDYFEKAYLVDPDFTPASLELKR